MRQRRQKAARDYREERRRKATPEEIDRKMWEALDALMQAMAGSLAKVLGETGYAALNLKGVTEAGDPATRYTKADARRDYLGSLSELNEGQYAIWWGIYAQLQKIAREENQNRTTKISIEEEDPSRLGPAKLKEFFELVGAQRKKKPSDAAWYADQGLMEELRSRLENLESKGGTDVLEDVVLQYGCEKSHVIEARGGCGKTKLLNLIEAFCRLYDIGFCAMSFSGYASTSLKCGTTCHSRFQIDIETGEVRLPLHKTSKNPVVQQLARARVFIVDEVFSLKEGVLLNMMQYIQQLQGAKEPEIGYDELGRLELFGADNLSILSGDRSQILPIVRYNCSRAQYETTILNSPWASQARHWSLVKNMRIQNKRWAKELDDMAEGLTERDENGKMGIPASIAEDNVFFHKIDDKGEPQMSADDRAEISMKLFPKLVNSPICYQKKSIGKVEWLYLDEPDPVTGKDDKDFVKEVITAHGSNLYIAMHQSEVSRMNTCTLNRMEGTAAKYVAQDTLKDRDIYAADIEGIEECNGSGGLRGIVEVKLGTLCTLSSNLCFGWMKGVKLVIAGTSKHAVRVIRVDDVLGERWDQWVWLPRCTLDQEVRIGRGVLGVIRRQIPIMCIYARTGDGVQGLTATGLVHLNFIRQPWAHGQTYVPFSRAVCPHNIFISMRDGCHRIQLEYNDFVLGRGESWIREEECLTSTEVKFDRDLETRGPSSEWQSILEQDIDPESWIRDAEDMFHMEVQQDVEGGWARPHGKR